MLIHLGSINPLMHLSAADGFDIACLAALCLQMLLGYWRGFARMIASMLGMLLALQGGYWLYPTLAHYLRQLPIASGHPLLGSLIPYLAAIILGLCAFLLLRLLLHRFFRLLVEQPIDRIFGMLAGLAIALMGLFLAVSLASLLPETSRARQTICRDSRTGRLFSPALHALLDARPEAVIRLVPDKRKKRPGRVATTNRPSDAARRTPARRPTKP